MSEEIDDFQVHLGTYFNDLLLATAYMHLGSQKVASAPPDSSITLALSADLSTEPMPLRELASHADSVRHGIAELYQNKGIAAWSDLLTSLFKLFVAEHIEGKKAYPQLKIRSLRLDFSSEQDFSSQILKGLVNDFAFQTYKERVKAISCIFPARPDLAQEISIIRKHVAMRNAIQHHSGIVSDEMLRDLGAGPTLKNLNQTGVYFDTAVGDPIRLYLPELNNLHKAFFRVSNYWKAYFA